MKQLTGLDATFLFEATGAQWAQPPQPAFPRRGQMKDILTTGHAGR